MRGLSGHLDSAGVALVELVLPTAMVPQGSYALGGGSTVSTGMSASLFLSSFADVVVVAASEEEGHFSSH